MTPRQRLVLVHDELVTRGRELELRAAIASTDEQRRRYERRAAALVRRADQVAVRIAELTPKPKGMSVSKMRAAVERVRRAQRDEDDSW